MRLTRACEYAIRCVLYLCTKKQMAEGQGQKHGIVAGRREIAKAMNIPDQFLGKIAQHLSKSGIVTIVQGAKGGILLNMTPSSISILDIVEAMEGDIFLNDCLKFTENCERRSSCPVHQVWHDANNQFRKTLKKATFDKLAEKESCMIKDFGPIAKS